jgi:hypothetical protein
MELIGSAHTSEWLILLKFLSVAVALVALSIPVAKIHRKFRAKMIRLYASRSAPMKE